jgi:mono/diheme cytochrome c family protein
MPSLNKQRLFPILLGAAIPVCLIGLAAAAGTATRAPGPAITSQQDTQQSDVERGKYLVEEVAECGECHTPRDANGNIDKHAWLQGATIWITPVRHIPNWADEVPPIAALGGYTEAQIEHVLEQGVGPQNEVLRLPMHTYHMKPADAKAIVAYLKTLPPAHR